MAEVQGEGEGWDRKRMKGIERVIEVRRSKERSNSKSTTPSMNITNKFPLVALLNASPVISTPFAIRFAHRQDVMKFTWPVPKGFFKPKLPPTVVVIEKGVEDQFGVWGERGRAPVGVNYEIRVRGYVENTFKGEKVFVECSVDGVKGKGEGRLVRNSGAFDVMVDMGVLRREGKFRGRIMVWGGNEGTKRGGRWDLGRVEGGEVEVEVRERDRAGAKRLQHTTCLRTNNSIPLAPSPPAVSLLSILGFQGGGCSGGAPKLRSKVSHC